MSNQLIPGISMTFDFTVGLQHTAKSFKSGDTEVLATPCMIMHMESVSMLSVANLLDEGQTTVGTLVNVRHSAATPVGLNVSVSSVLKEVDGRRLVFSVTATDEAGPIGEGIHERFIVNRDKFRAKAESRISD